MGSAKWECTPDDLTLIYELGKVLKQDQIAKCYGITPRALRNRFDANPEFRIQYDKGRMDTTKAIADKLVKKALGGDFRAIRFYLTTQAGWHEPKQIEHTGAIQHTHETAEEARRNVMGSILRMSERIEEERGATEVGGGQSRGMELPEVRMELLGPPGPVSTGGDEVVLVADVVRTGSREE